MDAPPTSLSLLDRLAGEPGDEDWERLSEIYSPLLRRWLRQYQVQAADADDLVQEVLGTLHRDLPAFRHNARAGAFRTWLRGILVHRLRDHWRARKYRPTATGDSDFGSRLDALADQTSSLSQAWDAEHDQLVMQRLLTLIKPRFEPHTWQAFEMQMLGGHSARAVAEKLAVSVDVAYAAKSRILNALRQKANDLVD